MLPAAVGCQFIVKESIREDCVLTLRLIALSSVMRIVDCGSVLAPEIVDSDRIGRSSPSVTIGLVVADDDKLLTLSVECRRDSS